MKRPAALLKGDEASLLATLSRLAHVNPFLPQRIDLERAALGADFVPLDPVWHARWDTPGQNPNEERLAARSTALAEELRRRLAAGARARPEQAERYQDLVHYVLYYRYQARLHASFAGGARGTRFDFYADFAADYDRLLRSSGIAPRLAPEHFFACCFQVRRAFHFIFRSIVGGSLPAARLRGRVWQSIFTHDLRRYQEHLYQRLGDLATLVSGASGTGKELVARAIGMSRYVPFDPATRAFRERFEESFLPLNLAALSPTLVESELFGHRRGAFTGALADRSGWLEACSSLGTVFLDEIGEVELAIQVKLLRVLETRVFQRLGETRDRSFRGKLVAATNRDLDRDMRAGRFREDLYYRLCADRLTTPTLAERLADSPRELADLLLVLAERLIGEHQAERLAAEAEEWIHRNLPADYPWPGNVRELGQCLSNVLVRREYVPAASAAGTSASDELAREFLAAELTADDLVGRYCTLAYARTGNYVETGRRLGLDRRTVKAKVDPALLARLRAAEGGGVTPKSMSS
jgi:hypothetical protein